MYSRRLSRLAVAGATLATGLAFADPAAAAPRYDPEAKTGFVDRRDVRKAFGWTGAELAERADTVVFDHDFWSDDTYSVTCGAEAFPVVHHRDFGRYELADTVAHEGGRGAAVGYHGRLTGFRLTGAINGISGTSVAPEPGQPCPAEEPAPGSTIVEVHLVSSVTGWALAVRSGDLQRRLLMGETPAPQDEILRPIGDRSIPTG